jgi:hypothetical protein
MAALEEFGGYEEESKKLEKAFITPETSQS